MRDEAYLSAGCSLRPLIVELRHGVMQLFKAILLQKRLFAECMMHMCRCELCGSCLLTTGCSSTVTTICPRMNCARASSPWPLSSREHGRRGLFGQLCDWWLLAGSCVTDCCVTDCYAMVSCVCFICRPTLPWVFPATLIMHSSADAAPGKSDPLTVVGGPLPVLRGCLLPMTALPQVGGEFPLSLTCSDGRHAGDARIRSRHHQSTDDLPCGPGRCRCQPGVCSTATLLTSQTHAINRVPVHPAAKSVGPDHT